MRIQQGLMIIFVSLTAVVSCGDDGGSTMTDAEPPTTTGVTTAGDSETTGQDPKAFCGKAFGVVPWMESNDPFDPGGIFGSCCDFTKVGDLSPGLIGETFWPCQVGLFCDPDQNSHPHLGTCDDEEPQVLPCGFDGIVYNQCDPPPNATPCEPIVQANVCDAVTLEWCGCDPPISDSCSSLASPFGCQTICEVNDLWCEPGGACCEPPFGNQPETTSGTSSGTGGETEGDPMDSGTGTTAG